MKKIQRNQVSIKMEKQKLEDRDMRTLSKREHKKLIRKLKRKYERNKGFIRLLKHLKENWDTELREDAIWNEYKCWSTDLKHMAEQGFLHYHEIKSDDGLHKYYKIGTQGFQYLYLRKINRLILIATLGGLFVGLTAIVLNLIF